MPKLSLASIAFVLLTLACAPLPLVVPSQNIPHQLASECKTSILVAHPTGKVETQKVTIPVGWWVASPSIIEAPPP